MSWRWPHNLQVIHDVTEHCYPGLIEYGIGDLAHQAEHSDHNPDARGIVHAIDLMFENDTNYNAGAPQCLAWLLTSGVHDSLEYVIHDRKIWSRSSGWAPRTYTGTDPHTNHIHVSGMHGTTGEDSGTGTGYSVTAEQTTPAGSPCAGDDMALDKTDLDMIFNDPRYVDLAFRVRAIANLEDTFGSGTQKDKPVPLTTAIRALPTATVLDGPLSDADKNDIATRVADLIAARLAAKS